MSSTPTRCRSCGRETVTTEDWRCGYCGQPKPVSEEPLAEEPAPRRAPSLWRDLRPQFAAAGVSAVIVGVALVLASELLLIAAAIVLVAAVAAKLIADGW